MNISSTWAYVCGHCADVHDSAEDAALCCNCLERQVWHCNTCGKRYAWDSTAEECCGGYEEGKDE